MRDVLLDDDSMVNNSSIGQKTSLSGVDDALEDRLDSVGYDFSNNLVTSITESIGSKVFQTSSIPALWDQAY